MLRPRLERCSSAEQSMFPLFHPDEGPEPGISRHVSPLLFSHGLDGLGGTFYMRSQSRHSGCEACCGVSAQAKGRRGMPQGSSALSGRRELIVCSFIQQVFVGHLPRPRAFLGLFISEHTAEAQRPGRRRLKSKSMYIICQVVRGPWKKSQQRRGLRSAGEERGSGGSLSDKMMCVERPQGEAGWALWVFGGRAFPAGGGAGVVAVKPQRGCSVSRPVGSAGGGQAWLLSGLSRKAVSSRQGLDLAQGFQEDRL